MMEEKTLATEMLHELKLNMRRWFIIAIIELVILVASNIGWLIYESQYEEITTEETTEYSQDANTNGDNSPKEQIIGE